MSYINWGSESPEQLAFRRQIEEQTLYEQAVRAAKARAGQAPGVAGSRGVVNSLPSNAIEFVVNTWDDTYLEFNFNTFYPINFTIEWGDGTTHVDEGGGGYYSENHTYPDLDQQYTARIYFSDISTVTVINFPGNDITGARITSITGLQNLTNLTELQLGWNSLTTVDLSGMSSLITVDISDQNSPNVLDENYLTSVDLTGCTAIENLRLDDSDFSNGIPDISDLIELRFLDLDQCGITGTVDLSNFPSLRGFDLSGNTSLTSVTISSSQPLCDGESINIYNCALTQTAVDNILLELAENVIENGYIDLTGGTNAIPSTEGLAAKTILEGKGWQVDINTP